MSFYVRPHHDKFFDYIFSNFKVMVWSSAQKRSVNTMCRMFPCRKYPLLLRWDRQHFGLTMNDFYRNVETVKDLERVWKELPKYDSTNTIILDDTAKKLKYQPYNLIQVCTFDHKLFEKNQVCFDNDLRKVINYLKILQQHSNVGSYMRAHPFDRTLDWDVEPDIYLDRVYTLFDDLGRKKLVNEQQEHKKIKKPKSEAYYERMRHKRQKAKINEKKRLK
ncbi:NLI interacting factor-like phosphatase-domain-containing protein [Gilbertella persicaria]|uniref:NLI interacting factor-like phosphatase-domain-containing protein n=1 Tax=Gilbertella persicaria TaxID=101096 RepID=UPI002221287A|nr:NLI interacting factor-like phosphatase-domain-containing protein [Gilbertella persicaria]KAI8084107.1 NLI interacting factor-like phosphatase-domain-containing protein [Gilbertella persicaria]